MADEHDEIPLVGRLETPVADVELVVERAQGPTDRRLENWIASNLDLPSDVQAPNRWEQLVGNLPGLKHARGKPTGRAGEGRQIRSLGAWSRFQVAYRRGITVVRLVDQTLVQRSHIHELDDDLMDLIDVGNHRIVLNFSAVARLGSWIVGVVGNAHRRCSGVDGGRLKICGLDPHLADIFSIVGMIGQLELHADEQAAIDGPWPSTVGLRALPVDIMSALMTAREPPPISGGSHLAHSDPVDPPSQGGAVFSSSPPPVHQNAEDQLRLHVQIGEREGRVVSVSRPRFVIGRERGCNLRLGSARVSKQHAVIERRQGRAYLVDLGSTNGTMVRGRLIRGGEIQLGDGDRIQIGPVAATVSLVPASGTPGPIVDQGEDLVQVDGGPAPAGEPLSTEEHPFPEEPDADRRIRCEVIQDVLVVTPQLPELDNEEANEALRRRLIDLFEQRRSRRVVVNLEFVNHISRQTIANLLAHHFRLDRAGGAMRICQAHARIVALLDQVRLTMLVDCYPTLDEAVLAAWGHTGGTMEAR